MLKFLVFLLLSGCTASNKEITQLTKNSVSIFCLEGLIYYQFKGSSSVVPAYNVDGTIKTFGETK